MAKHYTIGEIARLGLILGRGGRPQHDKAWVSRLTRELPCKHVQSPHGMSRLISVVDIRKLNDRRQGKKMV